MSQDSQSDRKLFTRHEAAKRHNCCYETIMGWEHRGLLIPVVESRPKRYTAEALDAAAEKADESRQNSLPKAQRELNKKLDTHKQRGRMPVREVEERLGVSRATVLRWRKMCPYLPNRRGLKHWGGSVRTQIAIADVETIESKLKSGAREKSYQAALQENISKAAAKRWPKPAEGQGSAKDAATWAGVSHQTIERAHKKGELPAASESPLRFDRDVVKDWAGDLRKTKGDLSFEDITARLSGPPGTITKNGESQKEIRVRRIIRKLEIKTYFRRARIKRGEIWIHPRIRCIREEQFPDVKAEYLRITTEEADELRPGEVKICDKASEHGLNRKTILKRLAKHAPADCVRSIKLKRPSGSTYKANVAPEAAIEAALRGEDWTPPPETPAPLPAETTDAPPEKSNGQTSSPGKSKRTSRKARPGRRPEWAKLLKVYDRLREKDPEINERELRRKTVDQYNRQYAGRGKNPKAKPANLRRALAYRRSQSNQNSPQKRS